MTTPSRKEQIKKAAEEYFGEGYIGMKIFVAGAEWADAFPDNALKRNFDLKCKDYGDALSEIHILKSQLAVAVEALEQYRGIAGHDCDKSTTKWSAADIALDKIKKVGND